MIPCERDGCPNYGGKCWNHCGRCFENIIWRPPGLDKGIRYEGPKPLNPDGTPHIHDIGNHIRKATIKKQEKEELERFLAAPNIPRPPPGIRLGITHLWYMGEFRELLKCHLCGFQNIYASEIQNHLQFTDDKKHEMEREKLR